MRIVLWQSDPRSGKLAQTIDLLNESGGLLIMRNEEAAARVRALAEELGLEVSFEIDYARKGMPEFDLTVSSLKLGREFTQSFIDDIKDWETKETGE